MNTITIDGRAYSPADLSDEAKSQLNMIQATDQEIQRLTMQIAIAQTARIAYAKALNEALPQEAVR